MVTDLLTSSFSRALISLRLLYPGLWVLVFPVKSQEPPREEPDLNLFIQELFPLLPDEAEYETLFEALSQRYNDPLDLNEATYDELAGLLILTPTQLDAFITFRNLAGPLLSLYELQAVPGMDLPTIEKLIYFVTVGSRPQTLKQGLQNPTQHSLLLRTSRYLEMQKGFAPLDSTSRSVTRYAGSPWKHYIRYRYARTGNFSAGLTMEKDAGETWGWKASKHFFGADFTSFHFQLAGRGRLRNFIAGDFQTQAGQGLVFSSGFSLGKGAEVIGGTYRPSLGTRPYTSVTEYGFMRGLTATFTLVPGLELMLFHARNRRSGTVAATGTRFSSAVITSFPTDGFHRTPTERAKRGNVSEVNSGFHLTLQPSASRFQAGVTGLLTQYDIPVEKRNLPYNLYEFRGRRNLIFGLHADYRRRNLHFFGESARSGSGGSGHVAGVIAALNRYWDLSLLGRSYGRHFHSFYGNPFKESSRPINESGVYSGIRYAPSRKWQYNASIDFFRFPWKKYLVDTTSRGWGYFVHVQWKPHKRFKAYTIFQEEHKQRNNRIPGQPNLPLIITRRRVVQLHMEWTQPLVFTFRTRIQAGDFRYGRAAPSRGIAIAHDLGWQLKKLEVSGRIALFRTDDYDSRQYISEKDVRYSFSLPSYFNKGTRHYLMLRYRVGVHATMWLRWARTRYNNVETIGSGLDEVNGKTKSELKMQVMYHL